MNNFTYCNPTRIVFGKDAIAGLKDLLPKEARVLMTYGGGSIKNNGVYDQVRSALAGNTVVEFGGIQPNPVYETLMQAVALARKEKVTFLLAVGGGSVLDGTKFIAAAIPFAVGQDPWDILAKNASVPASALRIGTVLTLPATGSETNAFAVISRKSTGEKLAFGNEHVVPRFAILDPATTMSLPTKQTRNGIVDAFVHVMEQYATYPANAPLQDRFAESILQTLVEDGPKLLAQPTDYDLRASLMWCATQALSGLIGCGVPQDWATHMIGHEITAFYGLDHAETLAIVLPSLLAHQKQPKAAKLLQFARRVWGITTADEGQAIDAGIAATRRFFESLGMPTRLAAYHVKPAEAAAKVRDRFTTRNTKLGERGDLTPEQVAQILQAC
jgi:NADP-dependent alcohol dehydrogenase